MLIRRLGNGLELCWNGVERRLPRTLCRDEGEGMYCLVVMLVLCCDCNGKDISVIDFDVNSYAFSSSCC